MFLNLKEVVKVFELNIIDNYLEDLSEDGFKLLIKMIFFIICVDLDVLKLKYNDIEIGEVKVG